MSGLCKIKHSELVWRLEKKAAALVIGKYLFTVLLHNAFLSSKTRNVLELLRTLDSFRPTHASKINFSLQFATRSIHQSLLFWIS